MNQNFIFGSQKQTTFIHQIQGATKLFFLLLTSIACMVVYHVWFLLLIAFLSLLLLFFSQIKWNQVSGVLKGFFFYLLINNFIIFFFFPKHGAVLYNSNTPLFKSSIIIITREQLFYQLNLILKYFCIIPLFLIFILTTNPSELASSLNKWGVSYKISYALALTIRYIPEIQMDFNNIKAFQQARVLTSLKKKNFIVKMCQKIKKIAQVIVPLIFLNLEKIDTIANALELRRFGKNKKRTWYYQTFFRFGDSLTLILGLTLLLLSIYLLNIHGRFYYPF
ncbi:energy-coupling factor transporter transmembrane component T family protein [Candidatus Phytoplasma solani]|uniref:ABC-type transport system, permease component n=1 Tax=Candidatus Phytoplasma solani TaxID=69896 RepID=A0A421NY62_9MOLU|nr:energy-coupling factor transporter transmembrane component T [Candidatus Phytoplasma solani]RMI88938.1 ABC-type transport system, permease component [Candidatus Phytoplasma solani]